MSKKEMRLYRPTWKAKDGEKKAKETTVPNSTSQTKQTATSFPFDTRVFLREDIVPSYAETKLNGSI